MTTPSAEPASAAREEALVKIACIQMEPVVGERDRNVRRSLALLEEAAGAGGRLVVLPELCNSGYMFRSRAQAFALAEEVPDGPTCRAWAELASTHALYLVAGINEHSGEQLYNAAVVIGPSGHIGTFRKVHLWNEEALFFEPGNLGFPVWRTPVGRIGTFICYDGWFPESYRLCALQGADIVCIPPTGCRCPTNLTTVRPWPTSCAWPARTPTRCSWRPPIASASSAASRSSARASS
jgi:N-carbamoylputrescine amidase